MAIANRPNPLPDVIVAGASARAAAFTALRAGWRPIACDLFGDADLRAVAEHRTLAHRSLANISASLTGLEGLPLVYTGGLEGHPGEIELLARRHPIWGQGAETLRAVRDPVTLAAALRAPGVEPPRVRAREKPPARGAWLWKPLWGAAGKGIRPWPGMQPPPGEDGYFQELAAGTPCSAVYVASRDGCRCLGATRQLVGEAWLGAPRFAWCGNIGPLALAPALAEALASAGERVTNAFGLRGLFGIDFLLDRDTIRPVELNPRYPASTEVLEHALGLSAFALHAAAFEAPPRPALPPVAAPAVLGKAVLYAVEALTPARDLGAVFRPDAWSWPVAADLPLAGTTIERGQPLLTVFAAAPSAAQVEAELRRATDAALRHFHPPALRPYCPP